MVFRIINANFERTDGLVEYIIQLSDTNIDADDQTKHKYDSIDKNKLWKDKIRIPKYQIQYLKNVLKMPQSFQNIHSFYGLYGPKMISIDFGLLELFNVKSTNNYNLDQLKSFNQGTQFMRWGRIIELNFKDDKQIYEYCKLNYYLLLLKERLYSIRACLFYKNDIKRKSFPYSYLFVFEMQDTIQFCLSSLKRQDEEQSTQELRQQSSVISSSSISKIDESFSKLIEKKMIHYQKYSNLDIRNLMKIVLIPFQIYYNSGSDYNYILILAEIIIKNENSSQMQQQQYHGTLTLIKFSNYQLLQSETKLIKEFIEKALKIKIKISAEQSESNKQDSDQISLLAEYIESNYLIQIKQQEDISQWSNQLFNNLPQYLLTNPPNSILPIQYLFPDDERSAIYYRQQFK